VDLLVNAGQAESDSITSFRQKNHSTSVSLQVSVPLYTGGAVQAQTRQALGRQAVVQAELDARTADLLVELQRQHQLHHSSGLRLVALGHAVASARLLVEATRKSVAGGVRTNLDVLDAQERLTQTLRDLAQTRYAHLQAGLRARSAAGILSEADLRRVAARFAGAP
jgi:protease secretion system outer membrane protein